jgi:hypothetical protein
MATDDELQKRIDELEKTLAGMNKAYRDANKAVIDDIKAKAAQGGKAAQLSKRNIDMLEAEMAATKRKINASLHEAETVEEATAALQKNMKQENLFAGMLNKRFDAEGKLTSKSSLLGHNYTVLGDAASQLGSGQGGFKTLLGMTGMAGGALGALALALDDTTKHFSAMKETGASLDDSMMTMRMNASAAGMSLDNFTNFISGTSAEVRRFGMEGLGAVTVNTRRALEGVGNLGMTTEMTTKALGDYMETETARMTYNQMRDKDNQAKVSQNFQSFVKDVDSVSKATGVARKDIIAAFKNIFKDDTMALLTKDMFGKAKDNLGLSLAGIGAVSQPVGDLMAEMIRDQKAFGSSIRSGTSAVMEGFAPGFADLTKKMGDGTMTAAQSTRALANMAKGIDKSSIPQLEAMSRAGDEGAKKLLNLARQSEALQSAAQRAEEAENSKLKSFSILMQNIEGIGQKLMAIFSGVINVVGTILSPAFNLIGKIVLQLGSVLNPLIDMLKSLTEKFSNMIDYLNDWLGEDVFGAIQLGMIGALWFLKDRIRMVFGNMVEKITPGLMKKIQESIEKSPMGGMVGKAKGGLGGAMDAAKGALGIAGEGLMGTKTNPMYVIMVQGAMGGAGEGSITRDPSGYVPDKKPPVDDVKKSIKEKAKETAKAAIETVKDPKAMKDMATGAVKSVGGALKANVGMAAGIAAVGLNMAASHMEEGSTAQKVTKGLGTVGEYAAMGAAFGPWGAGIGAALGAIMAIFENWDDIAAWWEDFNLAGLLDDAFKGMGKGLLAVGGWVLDAVLWPFKKLYEFDKWLAGKIIDGFKAIGKFFTDMWDGAIEYIQSKLPSWMGGKSKSDEGGGSDDSGMSDTGEGGGGPGDVSAGAGRPYGNPSEGKTPDLYGAGDTANSSLTANSKPGDWIAPDTVDGNKIQERILLAQEEANEIAKAKLAKDAQDNKRLIDATNRSRNEGAYNIV